MWPSGLVRQWKCSSKCMHASCGSNWILLIYARMPCILILVRKHLYFDRIAEDMRPVTLRKIVIGYPSTNDQNAFKFDMALNYKLPAIIKDHWNGKPILVRITSTSSSWIILYNTSNWIYAVNAWQRSVFCARVSQLLAITNHWFIMLQIFCSFRKSVEMAHKFLHTNLRLYITDVQKTFLQHLAPQ